MHIVLTGYMGAGKSLLAPMVAKITGLLPFSIDDLIVKESPHSSIKEIFSEEGESGFRDRESSMLKKLLKAEASVIDCGGGIIEREVNRSLLADSGALVIYLSVDFETVIARVGQDDARPLLRDMESARQRFYKRLPLYADCATIVIDANTVDPEKCAGEIAEVYFKRLKND